MTTIPVRLLLIIKQKAEVTKMIKYASKTMLNHDQIDEIKKNGWSFFTMCDEGGVYYRKGFAWINRIGYIIFSENVDQEHIDGDELDKIAIYDEDFKENVQKILDPIEDKCYIFLVKDPAKYRFEQVWTNAGLDGAKKNAKSRFRFRHKYYDSKDFPKMHKIINDYNNKVKKDTEAAISLLKVNGYTVVSENFAAHLD